MDFNGTAYKTQFHIVKHLQSKLQGLFRGNYLCNYMSSVVGRLMDPKYVLALIPVSISPDMAKGTLRMWLRLRIFRWGVYPEYPGGPSVIT